MDPISDDEFKGLIPLRLSENEYKQLEENLIRENKPEESIVFYTCNGHLIDGYPQYEICQKHGIKFRTVDKFTDRDVAMVWVINQYLAMPTFPAFVKIELASKRADILRRKEQAKQRMVEASHPKKITYDAFLMPEKQPAIKFEKINVTNEIAKEIKVSTDTVSRGLQLLKNAPEGVKEKLRKGEITINEGYVSQKKHDKELEQIKNKGTNESELQKNMHEMDKEVRAKKISTKIMNYISKIIPLIIPEHLKIIKVWIEQALSNSNPPAPTALTDTEAATETDSETKVN